MNMSKVMNSVFEMDEIKKMNLENQYCTYVSGSLVEGFGNVYSDVDIFCIIENGEYDRFIKRNKLFAEGEKGCYRTAHLGYRFDFEIWKFEKIQDKINLINSITNLKKDEFPIIHEIDLLLLHNIKIGKAIFGKKNYIKLKKSINWKVLFFYEAVKGIFMQNRAFEDLEGSILSEDYGTAFFAGRELINICTRGYLAYFGESNTRDKWMYRKLSRFSQRDKGEIMNDYMQLMCNKIIFNKNEMNRYYTDIMEYCKKYNMKLAYLLNIEQQLFIRKMLEKLFPETFHFFDDMFPNNKKSNSIKN